MTILEPIISLQQIEKNYPAPNRQTSVTVLKNVSLDIHPGSQSAIIGPSGSGKSSLLNIMGLLDKPTAGQAYFNQQPCHQFNDEEAAKIRNHEIGFIFQLHHLLPQCSVLENVLIPTLAFPQATPATYAKRARDLVAAVGLDHRADHRPAQLSGGEQLRVAIARALINQPRVVLADEPTGSLDQATAKTMAELLLKINHDFGTALVVVTHAQSLAAALTHQYELKNGVLNQLC